MDNETIIRHKIYPALREMGLRQNREKFYLDEAGHRGFSVDVGSSRGEVLIRVESDGTQVERLAVTHERAVEDALAVVAVAISMKRAMLADEAVEEKSA